MFDCKCFVNFLFSLDSRCLCGLYRGNERLIKEQTEAVKKVSVSVRSPGYDKRYKAADERNLIQWTRSVAQLAVRNAVVAFVLDCKLKIEAKEKEFVELGQRVAALRSKTISAASKNCTCGSFSNVSALADKCAAGGYSMAKIREAFETLNMVSRCDDLPERVKLDFAVSVLNDKTTLSALSKKPPFVSMLYWEDRRKFNRNFAKNITFPKGCKF